MLQTLKPISVVKSNIKNKKTAWLFHGSRPVKDKIKKKLPTARAMLQSCVSCPPRSIPGTMENLVPKDRKSQRGQIEIILASAPPIVNWLAKT